MKNALPILLIALLSISVSSCNKTETQAWQDLFNGENLDGWVIKDGLAEAWVEDRMIVSEQTDSLNFTYLVFDQEFSDFILEIEAKLTGPLNSGVLIRGISDPDMLNGRIQGFQMEIDQTERKWTGGIYEELGRKWLTPLEGMEEALEAYTVSDWNHYRIEAIQDTFKIWVNGIPTTHLIDGKTAKGMIGFQIHKLAPDVEPDTLRIKNVRIITEKPEKFSNPISLPPLTIKQ
jgi:hypothetical protein